MFYKFRKYIVLGLSIILIGCGRRYHIKGKVTYTSTIEKSTIIELDNNSNYSSHSPIKDVLVVLILQPDKNITKDSFSWRDTTFTDANGFFEIRCMGPPSKKYKVGLQIIKNGYKGLSTTYWDYIKKEIQYFDVVLVKNSDGP